MTSGCCGRRASPLLFNRRRSALKRRTNTSSARAWIASSNLFEVFSLRLRREVWTFIPPLNIRTFTNIPTKAPKIVSFWAECSKRLPWAVAFFICRFHRIEPSRACLRYPARVHSINRISAFSVGLSQMNSFSSSRVSPALHESPASFCGIWARRKCPSGF
jgi:hypothetical protein